MTRASLLFMVLVLISILFSPVSAEYEKPTAMVEEYSVDPPVLDSGGLGTIQIKIVEIGTVSVSNSTEQGTEEDPLRNSTEIDYDETVYIERVGLEGNGLVVLTPVFHHIGQLGEDGELPLTFVVRAPLQSGVYYPEIWMNTDGGSSRYPVPVFVDTSIGSRKKAYIILQSSAPDRVIPGESIPVMITLENKGDSGAGDTYLTIPDDDLKGIAPATSGKYYIGRIASGEQENLSVTFLSDKYGDPGLHHIPVSLQYTQTDGSVETEDTAIDIAIPGRAELSFIITDTNASRVAENQQFELPMLIRNTGNGVADNVYVALDLPMKGTGRLSLGKIAPDSESPVCFLVDRVAEGSYVYNATITYDDDTGTHTEARQMTLRVTPEFSFWQKTLIVLLVLSLLAGIVLLYRSRYRPEDLGKRIHSWVKKR